MTKLSFAVHRLRDGKWWISESAARGKSRRRPFLHLPNERIRHWIGRSRSQRLLLLFHTCEYQVDPKISSLADHYRPSLNLETEQSETVWDLFDNGLVIESSWHGAMNRWKSTQEPEKNNNIIIYWTTKGCLVVYYFAVIDWVSEVKLKLSASILCPFFFKTHSFKLNPKVSSMCQIFKESLIFYFMANTTEIRIEILSIINQIASFTRPHKVPALFNYARSVAIKPAKEDTWSVFGRKCRLKAEQ